LIQFRSGRLQRIRTAGAPNSDSACRQSQGSELIREITTAARLCGPDPEDFLDAVGCHDDVQRIYVAMK
jgi:transcriptional/translational regulatory protein YebC/TACO1